ncbi:hypothetical protein Goari_018051, partial [Gossypium aridum]|nr:hypothetical protein [Gossypium aridum]
MPDPSKSYQFVDLFLEVVFCLMRSTSNGSYHNNRNKKQINLVVDDRKKWRALENGWIKFNSDVSVEAKMTIARLVLEGLKLAWDKGYRRMCRLELNLMFRHIHKECNSYAYWLAKNTRRNTSGLAIMEVAPKALVVLLEEDVCGIGSLEVHEVAGRSTWVTTVIKKEVDEAKLLAKKSQLCTL